jgi:hypothetical protein
MYSISISLLGALVCSAAHASGLKFQFAGSQPGYTQVTPEMSYNTKGGYGYLGPKIFAVDVEEGNYDVTIRFGDVRKRTSTCIKAESRRLMIENIETEAGKFETRTITVNVRRPAISGGGKVIISDREKGPPPVADWDEHLTFEINGKVPGVASIEIKPASDAITLFIAGDSTVTDMAREPCASWGQMLPRFFQSGVAVSNHSWSGLTAFSFDH